MKNLVGALIIVVLVVATIGVSSASATQPGPLVWPDPGLYGYLQYEYMLQYPGQPMPFGPKEWCADVPGGLVFYGDPVYMDGQFSFGPSNIENLRADFRNTDGAVYGPAEPGKGKSCVAWRFTDTGVRFYTLWYDPGQVALLLKGASGKLGLHRDRVSGNPQTMTISGRQADGTPIQFVVAGDKISVSHY